MFYSDSSVVLDVLPGNTCNQGIIPDNCYHEIEDFALVDRVEPGAVISPSIEIIKEKTTKPFYNQTFPEKLHEDNNGCNVEETDNENESSIYHVLESGVNDTKSVIESRSVVHVEQDNEYALASHVDSGAMCEDTCYTNTSLLEC